MNTQDEASRAMVEHFALVAPDQLLPQRLRDLASRNGDAIYARSADDDSELTYRDASALALTWADAFRRRGVGQGDMVLVMQPPSIDELATWTGLAWLRAIEVPVNLDYRGHMLAYAIRMCEARYAVVRSEYLERLRDVAGDQNSLETVIVIDDDAPHGDFPFDVFGRREFLEDAVPASDLEGPQPWDTSCIIYTSGTTGPSKPVLVPWAEMHQIACQAFPLPELCESDRFFAGWPAFHSLGKFPLLTMALVGGEVVFQSRLVPNQFMDDMWDLGITTSVIGLPWLDLGRDRDADDSEIPLRNVMVVPVPDNYQELSKRFGFRINTMYGMTEIGAAISHWPDQITSENHRAAGKRTEGYPGYELRVVDENDIPVGPGVVGELVVRTAVPWTLCSGYHNMPDKTAEAWRNGWFHTGDAFTYDEDVNYYFVDRIKDAIRRRGENISSFEVELHVNEHPEVLETAAVPVRVGEGGDDEVKVVVMRAPGSTLTPEHLIEFLIPRMPRFMVPRFIEFVEELPKTDTQKVRKAVLKDEPLNSATWDREAAGISVPR